MSCPSLRSRARACVRNLRDLNAERHPRSPENEHRKRTARSEDHLNRAYTTTTGCASES
jgi:hypothetical protein